ncbi:MAG: helix-turn-helix domain-containing protein [Desulfobacteraceae bacterium]|jgi:excisionase family DNA binding protein
MPQSEKLLSTQEFAKKAGVSASTVSKWLRSGKIKGTKQSGKWVIDAAELDTVGSTKSLDPQEKSAAKKAAAKPKAAEPKAKSNGKTLSLEEFCAMTYLTESGILKWVKQGKLSSTRDESGQLRIDASNLENASIRHLIRRNH